MLIKLIKLMNQHRGHKNADQLNFFFMITWSSLLLSENFSDEDVSGELCWTLRMSVPGISRSLYGKMLPPKPEFFWLWLNPAKARLALGDLVVDVRLAIEYSDRTESGWIRASGADRSGSGCRGGAGGAKKGNGG